MLSSMELTPITKPHGTGLPILMCAPGGFDSTIDKWREASAWTGIDAVDAARSRAYGYSL